MTVRNKGQRDEHHANRDVTRTRFQQQRAAAPPPPGPLGSGGAGPPNPTTTPSYTMGMPSGTPFAVGEALLPLQSTNAPSTAERDAYDRMRDMGISGVLSNQLIHEQPAYQWQQQEMAALPDFHANTGVGSGVGGGGSTGWNPPPGPNYNYHLNDLMLMTDPPLTES